MILYLVLIIIFLAATFSASRTVKSNIILIVIAFVFGSLVSLLDRETGSISDLFSPGLLLLTLFYTFTITGIVSLIGMLKLNLYVSLALLLLSSLIVWTVLSFSAGKQIEAGSLLTTAAIFFVFLFIIYLISLRIDNWVIVKQ